MAKIVIPELDSAVSDLRDLSDGELKIFGGNEVGYRYKDEYGGSQLRGLFYKENSYYYSSNLQKDG
jgi:hypothetical protein